MSMISSLDALEAATDATAAPRAAVFQPKVKPRARKGGGGGETKSVPSKPAPAPARKDRAVSASADPSPLPTPAENVAPASELSIRVSEPDNAVPVVDINGSTAEEAIVCEEGPTPATDDSAIVSMQDNEPGGLEAAAEHRIVESDSELTDERSGVQDEVAVRSDFPLSPEATRGTSGDEDVGVAGRSSPERDGEVRLASEGCCSPDAEKSDLPKSPNPNSASRPKRSRLCRAVLKEQVGEDSEPPAEDIVEVEEEGGGGEEEAIAEVEDEAEETVSEDEPLNKRGRKRKFPHSTSQPRMNRPDRDGVALRVDFSKTDLSNPSKLTMREIIRRAEAIERKKLKAADFKKSAQNAAGKQQQAAIVEAPPARDAVSMAPQVQVINGRIVINEQSLMVGAYETSRLNTETYTRVEENASRLNYNSYRDKTPMERWKAEDTNVFYLALKQFGTDFELIQNLFPGRTRRQVKAKFKKEERNNPRRLQDAFAHRPKDQSHYTDMISRLKGNEPDPTVDDPFPNIDRLFT